MTMFMVVGGLDKDFDQGAVNYCWILYVDGNSARAAVLSALEELYEGDPIPEQLIIASSIKTQYFQFVWKAPTEGFLDIRG